MTKVVVLTDTTDYKLPPAVEAAYNTAVQAAIATGVSTAISGMGDVTTAVANAVTAMTTPTILKNANVLPSNARNLITGWFHCDGYGAVGDGTTLTRGPIQNALNAAGAVYTATGAVQKVYLPAGIYLVDNIPYNNEDGSVDGAVSFMLPSGVDFFGPGTIKVKNGAYGIGANYGVIRSKSSGISSSKIREITINGNKENNVASIQCSNILLVAQNDVEVSGTRNYGANGNGILITGLSGSPATNIRVNDNVVGNATFVGIQVSRFRGLIISRNDVGFCGNNGIDIYGENGNTTTIGDNWIISDNRVYNCNVGIFPETASWGIVSGNICYDNNESNIHVNRANGAPKGLSIIGNQCTGGPIGIYVTGDMFPGAIRIRNNIIDNVTGAGIQLGGGGAALSYVYIVDNSIDMQNINTGALILTASGTTTWSQSMIKRTTTKNTDRGRDLVNYATQTNNTVTADPANT